MSQDIGQVEPSAELLQRIRLIWESARTLAARSVNTAHVCANWMIGRQIVEAEQGGADRAEYGQKTLKSLAATLTAEYGSGFSVTALKYMRTFYLAYPKLLQIGHAVRDLSATNSPRGIRIHTRPTRRGVVGAVALPRAVYEYGDGV